LEDELFYQLLNLCICELLYNVNQNDRLTLIKKIYEKECLNNAINLAYTILKQKADCTETKLIRTQIKELLQNLSYEELICCDIKEDIKCIFYDILNYQERNA